MIDALIFAIDPGADSGWALLRPTPWQSHMPRASELIASGLAKSANDRAKAIGTAMLACWDPPGALVVVAESWTAGGWKAISQVLGMGAAWGRWAEQLDLHGVPHQRVVRVTTQTWRKALKVRDKDGAVAYANAVTRSKITDHNVADAVCIGLWACHAPEAAKAAAWRPRKKRDA